MGLVAVQQGGTTLMELNIKTANKSDLMINLAAQCNLTTQTKGKTKIVNGNTTADTASATAGLAFQVVIDGEVVRTVAIDPSDPFLSAAELRALDLTQYVGPGEHTLEVRYGGRLDPDVSVITTRWPATTAMHSTVSLEASLPRATTGTGQRP